GFSTDFIGQNYDYPEATDAERQQIVERHRSYQQGLFWTMANHPRVPEATRKIVSRWGTCKDEFEREDGWQQQLYIREARRLVGDAVMTQHHCQGRTVAEDPVGMAAYTMDSHNVQRYVDANGHARNEGDVQVGGFPPYPISYRSLLPKANECTNLIVPVSLSASHMAFGSIRMEPVFMVLGQSSATAAIQAIRDKQTLHEIDYAKLREQLTTDKQVLDWKPVLREGFSIDPKKLSGIVVDDVNAKRTGFNGAGHTVPKFVGHNYRHDGDFNKGQQLATYSLPVAKRGRYAVRMSYTANPNRASNVPVTITRKDQTQTVMVNQRKSPGEEGFLTLVEDEMSSGNITVTISNEGTNGYVVIDAVHLMPIK
uniref:FAD-dependent oxidoreductase n=1 Tax=Novipirellula sp. TaxID=2795430 RepID=UPI003567F792